MIKICDGKPNDGIVRMLIDQLQKLSTRRSSDGDHCASWQTVLHDSPLFLSWRQLFAYVFERKDDPDACHFERTCVPVPSWSWRKQGSELSKPAQSWIRMPLTLAPALGKIGHHENPGGVSCIASTQTWL